jgi:hypothetical protein
MRAETVAVTKRLAAAWTKLGKGEIERESQPRSQSLTEASNG